MTKKGKIIASILSVLLVVVGIVFGSLQVGKAEDTAGKITLNKTAVATSDRKAKVTLEIQTSELKQSTAEIVLVMDTSGSMEYCVDKNYNCSNGKRRIDYAQTQAKKLVEKLLPENNQGNVRIAVISFGKQIWLDESTKEVKLNADGTVATDRRGNILYEDKLGFSQDKTYIDKVIDSMEAGGGTNVQAGLDAAKDLLTNSEATTKIVVLISDGEPTYYYYSGKLCGNGDTDTQPSNDYTECVNSGYIPSTAAKAEANIIKGNTIGAEIYTIGFGASATDIASFLKEVATANTADKTYTYTASNTTALQNAMDAIAKSIKNTLATDAYVTDTIPSSFKLTKEAKDALITKYGNEITLTENEDGTTTIKVHYAEISSVQGTYIIEYEVEADKDHYGAMYTNVAATFEATATEDNTYYQNKDIEETFNKPVVAISRHTEDNDYSNVDKYIAKEGSSITIDSEDSILNNDSLKVHEEIPT